ncbi:hypothetical protein [Spirosoma utsteinense]|uniref:YD repeat-containing protein n=1 Tax=Spirosoma utsteinense TaxID=2585773 RepID=A0ABR6WDL8_9BACT|nr:hypothetical protein [Spirosoma utsteinense]MBC3789222.1 YD repeat-containing protein [Spirosoma utsteinense]MBC3794658.1 YD repeat-containing protein [Spirosoma utsteinense]
MNRLSSQLRILTYRLWATLASVILLLVGCQKSQTSLQPTEQCSLTKITEVLSGPNGFTSTSSFDYNPQHQLILRTVAFMDATTSTVTSKTNYTYDYDTNGFLTAKRQTDPQHPTSLLSESTYIYTNGQLTQAYSKGSTSIEFKYRYDAQGQLTDYSQYLGSANRGYGTAFHFDKGKLVSASGGRHVDQGHLITDYAGDLSGPNPPTLSQRYTYDQQDRLIKKETIVIRTGVTQSATTYSYNDNGVFIDPLTSLEHFKGTPTIELTGKPVLPVKATATLADGSVSFVVSYEYQTNTKGYLIKKVATTTNYTNNLPSSTQTQTTEYAYDLCQ